MKKIIILFCFIFRYYLVSAQTDTILFSMVKNLWHKDSLGLLDIRLSIFNSLNDYIYEKDSIMILNLLGQPFYRDEQNSMTRFVYVLSAISNDYFFYQDNYYQKTTICKSRTLVTTLAIIVFRKSLCHSTYFLDISDGDSSLNYWNNKYQISNK